MSFLISHPPVLFWKLQRNIYISLLVRSGRHKYCQKLLKRRVVLISELKITFRADKFIEQMRQTLESIFTSNQSSTTPFLEKPKDHIYITSGCIWMAEILLEIIQDAFFWSMSSKLRSDHPNKPNRDNRPSNQWSFLISHPPPLLWKLQITISI